MSTREREASRKLVALTSKLDALMRRAYAQAKAAGTLELTSDGWEQFQLQLPIQGMPPWTCARLPGGQFRVHLGHLHQCLAPDRPWEHVEHRAYQVAQRLQAERRGRGFGAN